MISTIWPEMGPILLPFDKFGQMELQDILKEGGFDPGLLEFLDPENVGSLKGRRILIKYGGNAMKDPSLKRGLMKEVTLLRKMEAEPILVHGGGPFIQQILDEVGIRSDFHGGHRRTSEEAMKYVEMALKGEVNGSLVEDISHYGTPAVGLSGKDGSMVSAEQRYADAEEGEDSVDLGHVGNVSGVDPQLLKLLLKGGYIPVLAPIAIGPGGKSYNVNADMFAGHIAGALKVDVFLILTDVDGLMRDKEDPESLISEITLKEAKELYGTSIKGGMLPKMDACEIAIREGVENARMVNGTRPHVILKELLSERRSGTLIENS